MGLKELQQKDLLNQLLSQHINLHGRRVIGAGKSIDFNDYVIRGELQDISLPVYNVKEYGSNISAFLNVVDEIESKGISRAVLDARGLGRSFELTSSIPIGNNKLEILLGASNIDVSASTFATFGTGSLALRGVGKNRTILNFDQTNNNFLNFDQLEAPSVSDLSINFIGGANTSKGILINASDHTRIDNVALDGFKYNLHLTGTNAESGRAFDTRIINLISTNFTHMGILIDRAVDTYFNNVLNWGTSGNPNAEYGFCIDTGASGIYILGLSLLYAGFRIKNSNPGLDFDFPPEHIFGAIVLSDSIYNNHAFLFDQSLSIADARGAKGKNYQFFNPWGCFTQTSGTSGFSIEGGQNIKLHAPLARLNSLHGIRVLGHTTTGVYDGPELVEIHDIGCFGNNTQNDASGSGLRIEDARTVTVVGGYSGNEAGEGPNQKYGLSIVGTSDQWICAFVNVNSNVTQGVLDSSSGGNKTLLECRNNAAGILDFNYFLSEKFKFALGDGNFSLDFNNVSANNPVITLDSGDFLVYDRASNNLDLYVGSAFACRIALKKLLLSSDVYVDEDNIIANNVLFSFASGDYIAYNKTSNIFTINIGSAVKFQTDTGEDATNTSGLLSLNGTLRRISVDNSDLGSGVKKYLYLS